MSKKKTTEEFIEQAKNPNSFKDINIDDFRFNIAPIKIKLDGDDMESCIDTEMMARFLRLQDRIYDFVKYQNTEV